MGRRWTRGFLVLLVVLCGLFGCGSDEGDGGSLNPSEPDQNGGNANLPPEARPGADQLVTIGTRVDLDAGASFDPEGEPLDFQWFVISTPPGSTADLQAPGTATPFFTPTAAGDYVLRLVVTDPKGKADSATVQISVFGATVQPPVDIGPDRQVTVGTVVPLNATVDRTFFEGPLNYSWILLERPGNSNATLAIPTGPSTSLTVDLPGLYRVKLSVSDQGGALISDSVTLVAGDALSGRQLYTDRCEVCHSLGNFDPVSAEGAPDLFRRGDRIPLVFTPSHAQILLTADEIAALRVFVDNPGFP